MAYLQTLRRACADALDDMLVGTAYGVNTVSTVKMLAIASSASNLSAGKYNGKWIYHILSNGNGQQRATIRDSLVVSTGTISVHPNWGAPSDGDQVEITGLFPCISPMMHAETNYRSLINAALRMLVVFDRYSITITAGTTSYTLPVWLREDRIVRTPVRDPRTGVVQDVLAVYEPAPISTGAPVLASWRRPSLVPDAQGNTLKLDVPFITSSGSISIDVVRPADTVIAPFGTGVYADSTTGLVNDLDEAKVETPEVVEVFKMLAYEALMNRDDNATWRPRWEKQVPIARSMPHFDKSMLGAEAIAAPGQAA